MIKYDYKLSEIFSKLSIVRIIFLYDKGNLNDGLLIESGIAKGEFFDFKI